MYPIFYVHTIILLQTTAKLLYALLAAQLKPTFHKINVHAAMTPADIWHRFEPAFEQAKMLKDVIENKQEQDEEAGTTGSFKVVSTAGVHCIIFK